MEELPVQYYGIDKSPESMCMYKGTFSAVRSGGYLSDWFETTVRGMQGCFLSPLLFNVFLKAIMSRAMTSCRAWIYIYRSDGDIISGNLISNLRFANEISTLAESNQALQEVMSAVSRKAKALSMMKRPKMEMCPK